MSEGTAPAYLASAEAGGWRRRIASLAHRFNAWSALRDLVPNALTVVVYHRIDDPRRDGFFGFAGNVSASREVFADHLDYLAANASVIDLDACIAWARHNEPLPPRAVLITFDDGYRDNLTAALPELSSRGMPAVLFAAADFIDGRGPFYWDIAAEAFRHARKQAGRLPLLGEMEWPDGASRERIASQWITRAKALSTVARKRVIGELIEALGYDPTGRLPPDLALTGAELREMQSAGVEIGAHTVTHPILANETPVSAEWEIRESCRRIGDRAGSRVRAFAYPNGQPGDFTTFHQEILRREGIELGFAAHGALTLNREARRNPHCIRRICILRRDDAVALAAKLSGINRVLEI